jgi:hypothetical protein
MPNVVSQQTITITTANGDEEVNNPLFTFQFNPSRNTNLFPGGGLADSPQTVRSATANTDLGNANLMMRAVGQIRKHDGRSANSVIVACNGQVDELQHICDLSNQRSVFRKRPQCHP